MSGNMGGKTVLLLGGSDQQLTSFEAANRLGYRTVLCDWDAECPGRALADSYYEVSTLDREAVLEVARTERVDGVVSYASDAPAPVAAWVSERLGLPTNPYESVAMLCDKGRFRKFLSDNSFNIPENRVVAATDALDAESAMREIGLPLVVKPVDSAGSRGVTIVREASALVDAFNMAADNTRKGEIVLERYIETHTPGRVIEAELFIEDGSVVSWGLMSAYRDLSLNGIVPSCYIHPIVENVEVIDAVRAVVSRLVEKANIVHGAMNIELICDKSGRVFIVDVGPRNGGNYLSSFFSRISGEDIVEATLRVAVGEESGLRQFNKSGDGLWVQLVHHACKPGVFKGLLVAPEFQKACLETHLYKEVGERVNSLSCVGDSIGVSMLHVKGDCDVNALIARLSGMYEVLIDD